MTINIQKLRENITDLAMKANNLLEQKGGATWTAEEQTQFDEFANEISLLKNQVLAAEKMREIEADKFFNATPGKKEEGVTIDALTAVALYMRFGNNGSPEQLAAIRNAMSTTTTTEGGFTVPAEVATMVIDKLKAYGGMRDVATILSTVTGVAMNFPTSDGTGDVGEIVGQNAAAAVGDITVGTVGLNPFYYSSKQIALPLELIQDSAIDVVAYVIDRLATRIARIQNTHFTTGGGTTVPDGVIPNASVGKTGLTGQNLSVIYDDLVDLKHSVNSAYRTSARFMMNDLSVAVVSKLKDLEGRPIWAPSVTMGAPDVLLGFPVAINDDVAVMAAGVRSIAFGDFSKYTIRDVAGTTLIRRFDDSAFALKNQVGFCGWTRSGGNLLDPAAVKVYVNGAAS